MKHPRLRDGKKLITCEPYPINNFPQQLIKDIGGYFIYLLYTGRKDLSGSDWGDAFAKAVGGMHLDSPVGIADVVAGKMAWSLKTVKSGSDPFKATAVRLISGRCSPFYSFGISDPFEDIQATGRAVLGVWNERINIACDHYNPIRTCVLIRSKDLLSFTLFEKECHRYDTSNYVWEANDNGNLVGKDISTGMPAFTWQPHGSQFTIHEQVPAQSTKFRIRKPPIISPEAILSSIGFDESWVEIISEYDHDDYELG